MNSHKNASTLFGAAPRRLASSTTRAIETPPFSGRLVGRMSSSGPDNAGDAAVAIAAAVRGTEPGIVRLTLWGTSVDSGGIAMRTSEVSYRDERTGAVLSGSIVGLDGNRVVADVESPSGQRLRLLLELQIDPQAGTVAGVISASTAS